MNAHERVVYDGLLDTGSDIPTDCPVCWNGDGEPCTEECADILERAATRRVLRIKTGRLYRAARAAIRLARRYKSESSGVFDHRVRDIFGVVHDYRCAIRAMRSAA